MRWLKRLFRLKTDWRDEWDQRSLDVAMGWNRNTIAYRITDPIWYVAPNGDHVQVLPDGTEIRYGTPIAVSSQ
ncbi:hypothetical protein SEA_PAINTERBOY_40 [Mycobacterium phage PainterBoy]|nr:hypothetical protein SEA_LUCYEDI_40 [Mycobacterium phage Lucyedi]QNJ55828.1 hypothetical protein SEA_PAINTERBOY_40 [Mycobacterium phage PainterBoy]